MGFGAGQVLSLQREGLELGQVLSLQREGFGAAPHGTQGGGG